METMTDRVMKVAKERGLKTMADVERHCDIPVRTLSNMADNHRPRDTTLRKICEALNITENYILYGTDAPDGIAEQQSLFERSKPENKGQKPDKLRQFVKMLASMDDKDFETMIEYMTFLKTRKG